MPEHHSFTIRDYTVEFHIYVDISNSAHKVSQLQHFFSRLPDQHLSVLYPIFIMDKKPGGRDGGGTWPPNIIQGHVMGRRRSQNTGIPDEDLQRLVVDRGRGLIGLSKDRWERPIGRLKFTVFHEVGHCIDFSLGLIPRGATEEDFAGMETNRCGAGGLMSRRAVEAYARFICSPGRIFHTLPPSETRATANQRLTSTLRRSPAFRSIPNAG